MRRWWMFGAYTVAAAAMTTVADAQMLGVPVLQNAFPNPGFTVAGNVAGGEGALTLGVASAWAPDGLQVQFSGGLGLFDPDAGESRVTWGVRGAVPLPIRTGLRRFGVAAFGGVGGASRDGVTQVHVPLGVGLGYRGALGARRGISGYVTPFYSWTRQSDDADTQSAGVVRVAIGLDVALLPYLGLTLGLETGDEVEQGEPGPTGALFGVGLSYALRRNR